MSTDAAGSTDFAGLAVVVVNFGSHQHLSQNLGRMTEDLPGALFVVVDNWHSQTERESVTALAQEQGWTLVPLDTNTGFGTGCNHGARAALDNGATHLLFINPDAVIDAASVRLLLDVSLNDRMALVAPRIVKADGSLWSAGMDIDVARGDSRGWHRRPEFPYAETIPWFTGACLLLSKELWEAAGGFDDDYFLYWEDVDFSVRVRNAGGTLHLVDEAVAQHDVGGTQSSQGQATKSELYYYFNIRNRSIFARKHLDVHDRRHWKAGARASAWAIILRGGRRQFLRPVAPLRALWRGLRDSNYGV